MALNIRHWCSSRGPMCALLMAALWSTSAQAGVLRVEASGPDGRVLIDGTDTGKNTPAVFYDLAPGSHRIDIEGQCSRGSATVVVDARQDARASIEMQEGSGLIVIHPTPDDASISIDGQPIKAGTELPVACGPHALNVSLAGHLPAILTIDVAMDDFVELPVTLEPQGMGKLIVNVVPTDATLLLDGTAFDRGDADGTSVLAGPHVLRAEASGYAATERQFSISDGATRTFDLELAPIGGKRTAAAGGSSSPRADRAPKLDRPSPTASAKPWAGYGVTTAGVGVLGYGIYAALRTVGAYRVYSDNVSDGDYTDQSEADAAYNELVRPRRAAMFGALAAGTVLTASGVTMVVRF